MHENKCPICATNLDVNAVRRDALKSTNHLECSRCGNYSIHDLVFNQIDSSQIKDSKSIISYWIQNNQNDENPPFLTTESVQKILTEVKLPDVKQKVNNLIMYLGKISSSGESVEVELNNIVSKIGCRDKESLLLIFDHLNTTSLVEILRPSVGKDSLRNRDVRIVNVNLTVSGLETYNELTIPVKILRDQFKFKQYKLSQDEKIWLEQLLKFDFTKVNLKQLKVKVLNMVSKDFDHNKIDRRLIKENRLTLMGLWHIEPTNPLIKYCAEVINRIKTLLLNNPDLNMIDSFVIGSSLNIPRKEVEISFMLLYDFGFFNGAQPRDNEIIFKKLYLSDNGYSFDNILSYNSIDETMESFFNDNNPDKESSHAILSLPNKKLHSSNSIWDEIFNEYEIDKRSLGKKINFVKSTYKKEIIFRDIEHSYVLAKNGFSKSAVILAGSVIEELLRLFLSEKGFDSSKTFEKYIEICEAQKFLKLGISRLSDSVRHFRNLVHLEKENDIKDSVSKSMALGAVASIFTIINDF